MKTRKTIRNIFIIATCNLISYNKKLLPEKIEWNFWAINFPFALPHISYPDISYLCNLSIKFCSWVKKNNLLININAMFGKMHWYIFLTWMFIRRWKDATYGTNLLESTIVRFADQCSRSLFHWLFFVVVVGIYHIFNC